MGWQDKISLHGTGAKLQYAALCWQLSDDGVEVLLITSRDTGRWVIPKGWPIPGLAPEAAAAQEAWEEAGVDGVVHPFCIGRYGYEKTISVAASVPCAVAVYGVRVATLAKSFPEAKARDRMWFPLHVAAGLVAEPDLSRIITGFQPPQDGRPAPIAAEADLPARRKGGKLRGH